MIVEPPPRKRGSFLAVLLMVVGALIFTLCGLCSGLGVIILLAMSEGTSSEGDVLGVLTVVLIFGGIPLALGGGLFWLGLYLNRKAKNRPE